MRKTRPMSSVVAERPSPQTFNPYLGRGHGKGKVLDFNWGKNSNDQERMMFDGHRFLWVGTGTKTGKTTALAKWLGAGLAAGERCAWIGPFHKRTRTGFNHIASAFAAAAKAGIVRIHSGNDMRIDMPGTGGVLECFSGDNPSGIYGEAFDRVVVDEATRMSRDVYPAVMSTVTATGGKVRFAFNLDQGRRNWAVQGFLNARAGDDPDHGYVFLRTDESPYVKPETIEMMRRALPERVFRALYMGEIQEDGAGVFRNVESVHAGTLEDGPRPGRQYVVGLDLARKSDYSVSIVMDVEFRHVVAFDRRHGEPWLTQVGHVAALAEKWNGATVIPDATGVGDVVIEALLGRNVRLAPVVITGGRSVTETGVPKTTLIQNLIVAIEKKGLTFPAELIALTDELKAYEYDTTAMGALIYSAPEGLHDDCVISLALAVWGAQHVYAGGPAQFIPAPHERRCAF
jgi:hypothetical protein